MKDITKTVFVGVDTHKETHTACAINCFLDVLAIKETANDFSIFEGFLAQLVKELPRDSDILFGLEDTGGNGRTLAQFLLSKDHQVREINPVKSNRRRKFKVTPEKSDPKDAFAIAKVLLEERGSLPLYTTGDIYTAIHDLSKHRDHLVKTQTSAKNRFHSIISQVYPQYKKFFSDTFGKSGLCFFKKFPTALHLKGCGKQRLTQLLKQASHNRLGKAKASLILEVASRPLDSKVLLDTHSFIIQDLIQEIEILAISIKQIEKQLKVLINQTGSKLRTLDGCSVVTEAKILSYIGDGSKFATNNKLARYAGVAPYEFSSGSKTRCRRSNRGNRDLNHALYTIGLGQIRITRTGVALNPIARGYFLRKIAEGKTKKEAIRCLMRRLVDIILSMVKNRTIYRMPKNKSLEVA